MCTTSRTSCFRARTLVTTSASRAAPVGVKRAGPGMNASIRARSPVTAIDSCQCEPSANMQRSSIARVPPSKSTTTKALSTMSGTAP